MVLFGPKRTKNTVILDRAVESKSYLKFYFYRSDNSSPMIFVMPFYSNPTIEESQIATYSKIRPIGRAGAIPTYLGSDNRKLRVSFDLIAPHIKAEGKNLNLYVAQYFSTLGSKEDRRAQFRTRDPIPGVSDGAFKIRQSWLHIKRHYLQVLNVDKLSSRQEVNLNQRTNDQIYDIVLWWVNLIRCSVINNAEKSLEPPPLIRLSSGILYNDIPCICTDYRIESEESAGYDLKTMFPRKIKVKMELEEVRLGDYSKYKPGELVKGDNLAGWEAVIEHGTKDPYIDIMGGYL